LAEGYLILLVIQSGYMLKPGGFKDALRWMVSKANRRAGLY